MLALISLAVLTATAPGLTAEANALAQAGKVHEARQKMEQAFLLAPGEVPVLLGLARMREDDGDIPGAIEALDSLLVLEVRAPEVADAQKHLERLKIRARPIPDAAREAWNRAGALLRLNRVAEGEAAMLEAEVLAPHWLEVLAWLARYYEGNGKPAEVLPRLRRMMAIATDSELAKLQQRAAETQIRIDDLARAERARQDAAAADKAQVEKDARARAERAAAEQRAREQEQANAAAEAAAEATRRVQAEAAEAARLQKAAELEAVRAAQDERTTTRRFGVGLAAVGAAGLVTFGVLEGLAVAGEGKLKNGGFDTSPQILAAVQTNNTLSTSALTAAVAGGALVVTGAIVALLNLDKPPPVSMAVTPGGAVVTLGGTFR